MYYEHHMKGKWHNSHILFQNLLMVKCLNQTNFLLWVFNLISTQFLNQANLLLVQKSMLVLALPGKY